MKRARLLEIIDQEIINIKFGINEELSDKDEDKIRKLIRQEVSAIFFYLFKKRKNWGA